VAAGSFKSFDLIEIQASAGIHHGSPTALHLVQVVFLLLGFNFLFKKGFLLYKICFLSTHPAPAVVKFSA